MQKIKTYIIKTRSGEYYCGKAIDISHRLKQHKKEKYPHWFSFKSRRMWKCVLVFDDNIEKKIKSFGVKKFYNACLGFNTWG